MSDKKSHFNGMDVFEHLKAARAKGKSASEEHHGIEPPGDLIAGADAAKETAFYILSVAIVLSFIPGMNLHLYLILPLLMFGLFLWKIGRSAALGWARIERVNQLIESERQEILYNREEERSELTEIYKVKGFTPPLLDKVIDVLMADDNKLLGIMLEEELGVSLEAHVHPLKQAFGSGIGVILASSVLMMSLAVSKEWGIFVGAFIVQIAASYVMAKIEQIERLKAVLWNTALLFLAAFATYFLTYFLTQDLL